MNKMKPIDKVELIIKLLDEVTQDLKKEDSRYLSMDNSRLRIKNERLFEENKILREKLNESK